MPKYLIELTPIDTFFFGGETTFGQGDSANYFAKSNLFPQQTTLLGVLRYVLLQINDLLPLTNANKSQANCLIGTESFDPSVSKQNFGAIERISPLFMRHNATNYFVRSKEFLDVNDTISPLELELKTIGSRQLNNQVAMQTIPLLKTSDGKVFNPKESFAESLVAADEVKAISSVFKGKQKVGITKYKNGIPKLSKGYKKEMPDNSLGFYKQTFYRLDSGWSFAFYAEIADSYKVDGKKESVKIEDSIVKMGGENRPFQVKFQKVENFDFEKFDNQYQDNEKNTPQYSDFKKVILLSDAYLELCIYQKCLFALTDVVDFRHIQTKTLKTTQWSDMANEELQQDIKPQKNAEKWQLVKRGSVFFIKDEVAFQTAVEATPHFHSFKKIGYNYYKII
jgi:CRISPR-associated protein Cmr3